MGSVIRINNFNLSQLAMSQYGIVVSDIATIKRHITRKIINLNLIVIVRS